MQTEGRMAGGRGGGGGECWETFKVNYINFISLFNTSEWLWPEYEAQVASNYVIVHGERAAEVRECWGTLQSV